MQEKKKYCSTYIHTYTPTPFYYSSMNEKENNQNAFSIYIWEYIRKSHKKNEEQQHNNNEVK